MSSILIQFRLSDSEQVQLKTVIGNDISSSVVKSALLSSVTLQKLPEERIEPVKPELSLTIDRLQAIALANKVSSREDMFAQLIEAAKVSFIKIKGL